MNPYDELNKMGPRIRYADEEAVDTDHFAGLRLQRTDTQGSGMSIRSVNSLRRRGSIDPATALPITYRTVSYQIEESKEKEYAAAKKLKDKAKDHAATELNELDWHTISTDELCTRLLTSMVQGVSKEQAARGLLEYGRNMPSKPPSQLPRKIFGYFFGGFGAILLTASILVFIAWKPLGQPPAPANLALAVVLVVVFVVQAAFNAWQDWSSSKVMASITTMLPDDCLVLRDGTQLRMSAQDMVPGDVLYIKAGNKLPADVRFVTISSDAKFNRSVLTGESLPISGTVDSTDTNYLETRCIGLQGTHCVTGSGLGVVVATGDRTVFGRIAKLTSRPKEGLSTLQKEIFHFIKIIVSLMLTMIIIVIIVWGAYIRKQYPDWISTPNLIVDCVSVAVAFIPEGLPIALTASLTITANVMRKNKVLCKSLKTVETLGAVSVICSDKTGTLTKNQMFVTECSIGSKKMKPDSARDEMVMQRAKSTEDSRHNSIDQLRCMAALCNAGEFDAADNHLPLHERRINGDATDQAVLRFSEGFSPVASIRQAWKRTFEIAFNSKNKFMMRIFTITERKSLESTISINEAKEFKDEDMLLTIKGAPDILINQCEFYTTETGVTQPLTPTMRSTVEEIKNTWSAEGKRVILLARKVLPAKAIPSPPETTEFEREATEQARRGLTLVGLVGIVDPPRDEIPDVVRILRRAGIRIFMVTGDFALTAQAIAIDCGIISNPAHLVSDVSALSRDKKVIDSPSKSSEDLSEKTGAHSTSITLSGPELISLNENQWDQLCQYDEIVFARTTPEQKLRIVKELQSREHIVGMTGDGVNDAPSLKAADIGIALGSGSDIAIEAADMVLLESFSAVVEAVLYGRVVYDNLKKTVAYLLPAGSFSEFWPVMTNVIFGLPQVLSSFLMIIICCFTDCAAATAIAYEKPEADVLLRRPRNPKKDRLVDWRLILQAYGFVGVLETISSFAMAYWYAERKGVPFSILWFKYGVYPPGSDTDHITKVLNEASSIYFVNLVVMQWFVLLALRTRHLSIFQQPPIFNRRTQNLYLFPAILFGLLITFFFLYVPSLQNVLSTTRVPVEHFFLPMAFGLGILLIDEARKFFVRRYPQSWLAWMAW